MSQYLMALWAGGGNVPPQLVIAKRLIRAGHHVRILAPSVLRDAVIAAGAAWEPYRQAPEHDTSDPEMDLIKDWEVAGLDAAARVRDRLIIGTASAICADLLRLIEERQPDALLVDYALAGGFLAGEFAALPTIGLCHSIYPFPAPGIPPYGIGLRPARSPLGALRDRFLNFFVARFYNKPLPSLNELRRQLGLLPLWSVLEGLARCTRLLVLTSPAFDFAGELPANVRYVGVQVDPDSPPVHRDEHHGATRPVVLVGLSTTYQKQEPALRRIVQALGSLDVVGKVTLGPIPAGAVGPPPSNVELLDWIDHDWLMPQVDLVVTHGGHGTVTTALRHGVPVVCFPMGRDQKDIAIRAVARRAGVMASTSLSASSIAGVIDRALRDRTLRDGARRLAGLMASDDPAAVVEELEAAVAAAGLALGAGVPTNHRRLWT